MSETSTRDIVIAIRTNVATAQDEIKGLREKIGKVLDRAARIETRLDAVELTAGAAHKKAKGIEDGDTTAARWASLKVSGGTLGIGGTLLILIAKGQEILEFLKALFGSAP